MRLYNYLNEGRVEHIEEQELKDLIVNNCSQAVDTTFIGRQSNSFKKSLDVLQGGFKGDSSKFKRKSANTANYYTLIIDNSKRGKDYPERSKSFICSSSVTREEMALTIPFDNSLIGVCPEKDIGLSFGHSLNGMSLDIFNDHLDQAFENYFIEYNAKKLNTDFKYFEDKLDELGLSLAEHGVVMNNPFMKKILQTYVDKFYSKNKTFTEYIGYLLDPKQNEFSLMKTGDRLPEKREVGFSGDAVFMTQDKYNIILQDHSSIGEGANN